MYKCTDSLDGKPFIGYYVQAKLKDKKLGDKYKLTKEIIAEAYPDIKWGNRS